MACSVSSAEHRSQSAPVASSSSGVVAAATTTSIMLTSSGGTGSPGASTTPLHARPAASTVVDHPLRDPGGHWRPGGGDSAKRKAPDRWSINEVNAKRSGGQSRRSALSGRPLIACQSAPTVARCGTPAPNWYSNINPPRGVDARICSSQPKYRPPYLRQKPLAGWLSAVPPVVPGVIGFELERNHPALAARERAYPMATIMCCARTVTCVSAVGISLVYGL